ncbi:hypothetical protein [Helicobacter sp. 11S02596-1]|uniref:hypothetical protein n=1 Tax=Helicobacter sp. 11S02596-1 TaxID=1476194 RepID=UPI000BA68CDD|nr:hypothetical protein [Helicobacter sp. 11S02596-1]PAF43145.1 hypothetical protein BJI48_05205 [Helicobacter sp. 11S02596-1]
MKNFVLLLGTLFFGVSILLGSNAQLEKMIKDNEGLDVKVVDSKPTNIKSIQIVSLEQPNGLRIPVLASDDGKTIIGISELLISSDEAFKNALKTAYQDATKHNKTITDNQVLKLFQKYQKNYVLKLDGKNKSKTTYMVVDPNCPYCYQEIQKLDETLQNSNVEMLVVGALGMDSIKKAASFYEDIKNKKSQKDKIALLKAVFEKSYQPNQNVDISAITSIGKELAQAGVNGVPYIIKK